jgi:hypothetical protein
MSKDLVPVGDTGIGKHFVTLTEEDIRRALFRVYPKQEGNIQCTHLQFLAPKQIWYIIEKEYCPQWRNGKV